MPPDASRRIIAGMAPKVSRSGDDSALGRARGWVFHAGRGPAFSAQRAAGLFTAEQVARLREGGELGSLLSEAREHENQARRVRTWLQSLAEPKEDGGRFCSHCGTSLTGRSDQMYCSTNCRVKAHHARLRGPTT